MTDRKHAAALAAVRHQRTTTAHLPWHRVPLAPGVLRDPNRGQATAGTPQDPHGHPNRR